ncbi:MAG: heparinase II/III family protein [Armatimonadetes bacterium]|nr:heparinase II/III family protein [Armatimonadota bacterium]
MRNLTIIALILSTVLAHAKDGRSFYTDDRLQIALSKIEQFAWARSEVDAAKRACAWAIEMSDQELWDFIPPPEQARALNVCFGVGCPVHGTEIFRKGGHYPWITSSDMPFKVKCPVGGEVYPSNDFQPWNTEGVAGRPETGPGYVDNGLGWQDEKGNRYWFVDYYIFWHRWQKEVLPVIALLGKAYLLSGESIYGHKCAVMLAKIASEYERFDYPTQAYHNGKWPAGINGRILDHIWSTGTTSKLALATDSVWPIFDDDPELLRFLADKGIDDPRRVLEQKLLRIMAEDIMRGFVRGNMGMHQRALTVTAIVLDNDDPERGPTTEQMRNWLMRGDGQIEDLLWNGFYRDGHGGESSPGYSSGWCTNFYLTAELLPRIGADIWACPKVKKMADIGLDMAVTGVFTPSIGDSGSIHGSRRIGWTRTVLDPAFRHYHDVRFAQALSIIGGKTETLWEDSIDDEVAAVVAEHGTQMQFRTRDLGGYGLAILEAGEDPDRRGVSMYYGHAGGGHGQRDRLTIEMFAFDRPMLTDMGYPAHWLKKNTYWTNNSISHYLVVVDEGWQRTREKGYLNTLVGTDDVQLMDAHAEQATYPGTVSLYRRTSALVDISPTDSYLLDIFRVRGGRQHDWSFHGPPFPEFSVAGGEPGPMQETGTLAGPQVPFGEDPRMYLQVGGTGAINPRKAEGVIEGVEPYADRSLRGWAGYSGTAVLTRTEGAEITMRIPPLGPGKVKVMVNMHDYNSGVNELAVELGGATGLIVAEPSGKVGARWVSTVMDLPEKAERLTLRAVTIGQAYALIHSVAVTTDLSAGGPDVKDISTAGFQYLFHVRRMTPPGTWSATWRKPDEDLALTMTMPGGCAREVILADAEPELQPGNPETQQYVLGRNVLGEGEKPEGGLLSKFVAVIEPHRGDAKVVAANRRQSADAPDTAVGVEVVRERGRDLIHSALDADRRVTWSGADRPFEVTGEFGLVTLDDHGVSRALLVGGTSLRCGDFELTADPMPEAHIARVDYEANTVTLDVELPQPQSWVGRVVIMGNELHSTSYTIREVRVADGHTTLGFGDVLMLVGMGEATGTDSEAATVTTDTQFTGYGRVDGGKHAGRWLLNEDRSAGYRIASFNGRVFTLDGVEGDLDAVYTDADGDGRRRFWIGDVGPGDWCRLVNVVRVRRVGGGTFEVAMNGGVGMAVPKSELIAAR